MDLNKKIDSLEKDQPLTEKPSEVRPKALEFEPKPPEIITGQEKGGLAAETKGTVPEKTLADQTTLINASNVGVTPVKSKSLVDIENVLQQDLADTYFKMEPVLQQKFKIEGEKAASKIEQLLKQAQVNTKMIFKLIWRWLKLIPGVNKFFIKQEAKIKTDKIIKLKWV